MIVILGAGLAGLSASYHLGHDRCIVLEKSRHTGGHIRSGVYEGITWDEGPHVSFTKHPYVRDLFARSVDGEFEEFDVELSNYFHGSWIDHPAQTNLYQVAEPLRSRCIQSLREARRAGAAPGQGATYGEWLEFAFGKVFAHTFPFAYTRKYWTTEPSNLTTDWIGSRVYIPTIEDMVNGGIAPLEKATHYITKARYPIRGGFESFGKELASGARVSCDSEVVRIDLKERCVWTQGGKTIHFSTLVSTIPLPEFISAIVDVPGSVREAARALLCSSLVLVNIRVAGKAKRKENWFYVYDEDKLATRGSYVEKLAPNNVPSGFSGLQIEVYFSRLRPQTLSSTAIGNKVLQEVFDLDLYDFSDLDARVNVNEGNRVKWSLNHVPWANVIFDHQTRPAMSVILEWLAQYGLAREHDDLDPITDWTRPNPPNMGSIVLAGRFGQWKYFWSDDCVLRGAAIVGRL